MSLAPGSAFVYGAKTSLKSLEVIAGAGDTNAADPSARWDDAVADVNNAGRFKTHFHTTLASRGFFRVMVRDAGPMLP